MRDTLPEHREMVITRIDLRDQKDHITLTDRIILTGRKGLTILTDRMDQKDHTIQTDKEIMTDLTDQLDRHRITQTDLHTIRTDRIDQLGSLVAVIALMVV
jgi:hypothetical protein